jgi:hypothetical protein
MTRKIYGPDLIVLLYTICLASVASAQTSWWRTYGGTGNDGGNAVQQTTDGGYIVAGDYYINAANIDVYLVKTNAQGDTLWTRTYGGPSVDFGNSVQQTADGGYIITGKTYSYGAGEHDVYLIKTNAQGDTLWTRTYGGLGDDDGNSVQQTADSGYIITGQTWSFGAGNGDVYLIKTNAEGDTLWTRAYGGTREDYGHSVQQTTDGGYVVAGFTWSFGSGYNDVYLIKTNAQGDTLWTRTYGGTDIDAGSAVQQTTDSGYVVAGITCSFGVGTPDHPDVYLIKTDAQGDTLWTKVYDGSDDDEGNSVQQTAGGGYIIAGYTNSSGAGSHDVYLIRTNAQGDTLWTRTFGGTNSDGGAAVEQATDSGYIVAGYTASFGAGNSDVYLIKTDIDGYVGIAEESPEPQAMSRKLAATVVRSLPECAVAFDAMGRRVSNPKRGVYFVRAAAAALPRKVLLVE